MVNGHERKCDMSSIEDFEEAFLMDLLWFIAASKN